MILISNFNSYVGGGEVIALEYAKYLKIKGYLYKLLCLKGSFLEKSALNENLEVIAVDSKFSSLVFSKVSLHLELASLIESQTSNNSFSILTITFRDLYNTLCILPYLKKEIRICHYILHPEDFKYGLSLRILYRKAHLDFNNNLLKILNQHSCLVLPNPNAKGVIEKYNNKYIPFCIENVDFEENANNRTIDFNRIKVITISRFVDFKIASVIGIMIYTVFHKNINLTVIGYGNWYLLVLIVSFLAPKRINLIGKCSKTDLINKIHQNDILYAQGTTLLLGVSLGLPSLISHYSRYYDWIFGKIGSVGWYNEENKYDFGDYRIKNFNNKIHGLNRYLNENEIKKVLNKNMANKINELSKNVVFKNLSDIMGGSTNSHTLSNKKLPKPAFIKTLLYQWKKW